MITVDVICYKYKPLKNKELPLKIRICKDRKTRYINLGVSTKKEDWDFEKNQPKADCTYPYCRMLFIVLYAAPDIMSYGLHFFSIYFSAVKL